MDNVSKAVLIVGEVLIAMLIVGLIASVVSKFGNFSSNMNDKMAKNRQEEFNNHFFDFEGRIDITAAEIVGMANFAKENNENSELFLKNGLTANSTSPDFVNVEVISKENGADKTYQFFSVKTEKDYTNQIRDFLKNNNDKFYSCNVDIIDVEAVRDKIDNTKILYYMIYKKYKDNKQITIHEEDNGRKGYVKSIKFTSTSSPKIKTQLNNSDLLTITNRNDFVINY